MDKNRYDRNPLKYFHSKQDGIYPQIVNIDQVLSPRDILIQILTIPTATDKHNIPNNHTGLANLARWVYSSNIQLIFII